MDRRGDTAAFGSTTGPEAAAGEAEFDLAQLQPTQAPWMSVRDKCVAWALGVSGSVAGVLLATGAAIVVINLLVFALSPVLGVALFASMFG